MSLMIFLIDLVFLRLDLIGRLPVLQSGCGESSFFDELLDFLVFLDLVYFVVSSIAIVSIAASSFKIVAFPSFRPQSVFLREGAFGSGQINCSVSSKFTFISLC